MSAVTLLRLPSAASTVDPSRSAIQQMLFGFRYIVGRRRFLARTGDPDTPFHFAEDMAQGHSDPTNIVAYRFLKSTLKIGRKRQLSYLDISNRSNKIGT
jgi:hypothetical protein